MNVIVLTGGTSKRFGSDKSQAKLGANSLLEILVSHLPECELIIVGPKTAIPAIYVHEEPIGAGPLAAIAAGMQEVTSDLVAIFATDMPFAPLLLNDLTNSLKNDAILPVDAEQVPQPLSALYRADALRNSLNTYNNFENESVKGLLINLNIELFSTARHDLLIDIDSELQLEEATKILEGLDS